MGIVVVIMIVWTAFAAGVANAQGMRTEAAFPSVAASAQPLAGPAAGKP